MSAHVHDVELELQINAVRTRFNAAAGSLLRLFKNNFTPTPESVIGDFVEADFDGYDDVDLEADWSEPTRVEAGHWMMETSEYQFDPPAMGDPQTIYGAYLVHDGEVVQSKRFANPIIMEVGGLPFRLRARYTQQSESIIIVQ